MELTWDLGGTRYVAAGVVALLLSLYFTPVIRRAALHYGVVDHPDEALKHHREPVPYLGGVAIFLSFLFSVAFTYDFHDEVLGILLAASIIVMLGLFDDLKVLSPRVKLFGQIVAAFVAVKAGVMIELSILPTWADVLLTMFWLVGMTNALNLIDVSDGLAAGVAAISGLFFFVMALLDSHHTIAMLMLALVGATLGFLVYNRPPARIFMGDTGSMLLGFVLGALAMIGHYTFRHPLGIAAPVVILGVPIFDTLFVIGARLARRIPVMRGSPDHYAVRLRNHGYSAGKIAIFSYVVSFVLGGLGLSLCWLSMTEAAVILGFVAFFAIVCAITFAKMGRSPRAEPKQVAVQSHEARDT